MTPPVGLEGRLVALCLLLGLAFIPASLQQDSGYDDILNDRSDSNSDSEPSDSDNSNVEDQLRKLQDLAKGMINKIGEDGSDSGEANNNKNNMYPDISSKDDYDNPEKPSNPFPGMPGIPKLPGLSGGDDQKRSKGSPKRFKNKEPRPTSKVDYYEAMDDFGPGKKNKKGDEDEIPDGFGRRGLNPADKKEEDNPDDKEKEDYRGIRDDSEKKEEESNESGEEESGFEPEGKKENIAEKKKIEGRGRERGREEGNDFMNRKRGGDRRGGRRGVGGERDTRGGGGDVWKDESEHDDRQPKNQEKPIRKLQTSAPFRRTCNAHAFRRDQDECEKILKMNIDHHHGQEIYLCVGIRRYKFCLASIIDKHSCRERPFLESELEKVKGLIQRLNINCTRYNYRERKYTDMRRAYMSRLTSNVGTCNELNAWTIEFQCYGKFSKEMKFQESTEPRKTCSALTKYYNCLNAVLRSESCQKDREFMSHVEYFPEIVTARYRKNCISELNLTSANAPNSDNVRGKAVQQNCREEEAAREFLACGVVYLEVQSQQQGTQPDKFCMAFKQFMACTTSVQQNLNCPQNTYFYMHSMHVLNVILFDAQTRCTTIFRKLLPGVTITTSKVEHSYPQYTSRRPLAFDFGSDTTKRLQTIFIENHAKTTEKDPQNDEDVYGKGQDRYKKNDDDEEIQDSPERNPGGSSDSRFRKEDKLNNPLPLGEGTTSTLSAKSVKPALF